MTELCTITFKLPTEIYEKASAILKGYGLTVEDACVLFLHEVVRRGELPFKVTQEDIEAVKKWEEMIDE